MGWEQRGGRRYYYTKVRRGTRVVSEYGGSGALMEVIAELDALTRLQQKHAHNLERAELCGEEDVDRELTDLFRVVQRVFQQAMAAAGYHRPKRGPWRKKRMGEAIEKMKPAAPEKMPDAKFTELMRKARDGDATACAEFYKYIDAHGTSHAMVDALVDRKEGVLFSYKDRLQQEAMRRKMTEIEQSLRRPDDTAIANLLIESAVLCWVRVTQAENLLRGKLDADGGSRIEVLLFCDKMLDRAHKRYTQTLQTLAVVRRVHLPPPI